MGNSLITEKDEKKNKNAFEQRCLSESSFYLEDRHVLGYSFKRAFLVWMGAVDPETVKVGGLVDNKVSLKYEAQYSSNVINWDIAGPAKKAKKGEKSFEFEYLSGNEVDLGSLDNLSADVGFFTYRIDVTEFFKKIIKSGMGSLLGRYTFSGLDCSESEIYKKNEMMLSSWAIVVIYEPAPSENRNVYIYPNFTTLKKGEYKHHFEMDRFQPSEPLKIITAVGGGRNDSSEEEALKLFVNTSSWSEDGEYLDDDCEPDSVIRLSSPFNSVSTIITSNFNESESAYWESKECVVDSETAGMDVDVFYSSRIDNDFKYPPVLKGDLNFAAGEDRIFPNFFILSHKATVCSKEFLQKEVALNLCSSHRYSICDGESFYLTLKIANFCWIKNYENLAVDISHDENVSYIPGTAEISYTTDANLRNNIWEQIKDKENGNIPFDKGYILVDELLPSDKTITIRLKFKHRGNGAGVNFNTYLHYTDDNKRISIPYIARYFKTLDECADKPVDLCSEWCGGCNPCETDLECPEGYFCEKSESACTLFLDAEREDIDIQGDGDGAISDEETLLPVNENETAEQDDFNTQKKKKRSDGCALSMI